MGRHSGRLHGYKEHPVENRHRNQACQTVGRKSDDGPATNSQAPGSIRAGPEEEPARGKECVEATDALPRDLGPPWARAGRFVIVLVGMWADSSTGGHGVLYVYVIIKKRGHDCIVRKLVRKSTIN